MCCAVAVLQEATQLWAPLPGTFPGQMLTCPVLLGKGASCSRVAESSDLNFLAQKNRLFWQEITLY